MKTDVQISLIALRTRRDLSRSLRDLSARQGEALDQCDYDELIEILGEKRSVIDRLVTLTPAARDWSERRRRVGEAERAEGDALVAETNRTLAEVTDAERSAAEELTRQRESTRTRIQEINAAGQVHSAYRDTIAPSTRRSLDVDR
jgi:hypothetical protein